MYKRQNILPYFKEITMKKLLIVLAILLVAGAGAFAEDMGPSVKVGGEFSMGLVAQEGGATLSSTGVVGSAEVAVWAHLSEYTNVAIELDMDGNPGFIVVDDWRLNTDIFKELGMGGSLGLGLTFGYFDPHYNHFNFVNQSIAPYLGNFNGPFSPVFWWFTMQGTGPTTDLAASLKLTGLGPIAISFYNTMNFGVFAAAVDGGVGPINFVAGFQGDYAAIGTTGIIYAELGFNMDLGGAMLSIPAQFGFQLGSNTIEYTSGAKVGIGSIASVAVGVHGVTGSMLNQLMPEVHVMPVDGLDVYAVGWLQPTVTGAFFNSVDLGVKYQMGPLAVNLGGVIAGANTNFTSLGSTGDDYGVVGSGFYLVFMTTY